jgi:hypothetical protein
VEGKSFAGALLLAALLLSPIADAGNDAAGGHSASRSHAQPHVQRSRSRAVPGVTRDARGRIARSAAVRRSFQKSHPCPSTGRKSGTCPGYVIDHVKPLKRGGADSPSNMQWQTKEAAREKDKTE